MERIGDEAETRALEDEKLRERKRLESQYGQVWDTEELQRDFVVEQFAFGFVFVCRKSDNKQGSLSFQHHPRFYYSFA